MMTPAPRPPLPAGTQGPQAGQAPLKKGKMGRLGQARLPSHPGLAGKGRGPCRDLGLSQFRLGQTKAMKSNNGRSCITCGHSST